MKKLLFSLSAMVFATGVFAQAKADDIAKINVEIADLGKIPQGIPATATFTVTNIGKTDLLIESAQPTCGCTVGDYTKTPIKPGSTGTITATYNAANLGAIDKHMNVKFVGADDIKSIGFKGEVLTTEEYAKINPKAAAAVDASTKVVTPVGTVKTGATVKTSATVKANKKAKKAKA